MNAISFGATKTYLVLEYATLADGSVTITHPCPEKPFEMKGDTLDKAWRALPYELRAELGNQFFTDPKRSVYALLSDNKILVGVLEL